jgi:hypothetical protein
MKRTTSVVLILIGCVFFAACGAGSGGGSPGDVVKKYVTALAKKDKPAALECIVPDMREEAAPMLEMGMEIASAFIESEGGLDSVSILRVEIESDTALVGYQTKTKQGMERSDTLRAQKVAGTWYIAQ